MPAVQLGKQADVVRRIVPTLVTAAVGQTPQVTAGRPAWRSHGPLQPSSTAALGRAYLASRIWRVGPAEPLAAPTGRGRRVAWPWRTRRV